MKRVHTLTWTAKGTIEIYAGSSNEAYIKASYAIAHLIPKDYSGSVEVDESEVF